MKINCQNFSCMWLLPDLSKVIEDLTKLAEKHEETIDREFGQGRTIVELDLSHATPDEICYARAALAMMKIHEAGDWEPTTQIPDSDELIWMYNPENDEIDGPYRPMLDLFESGDWSHWRWVKRPAIEPTRTQVIYNNNEPQALRENDKGQE